MFAAASLAARSLIMRTGADDGGSAEIAATEAGGGAVAACDPDAASCGAGASCSPSTPCVDLASTASLSEVVAARDAAFVLLPGDEATANEALSARIDEAVARLADTGKDVVAVTQEEGTEGYERLVLAASVESFPSAVVVGPLGQLALAEGEGRTVELLRAFVVATVQSSAGAVPCGTSCGK
jgi:hypothetical protein